MKRFIILAILMIVIIFLAWKASTKKEDAILPEESISQELSDPTFTWSYSSFEEDEIPRTKISLTARDENRSVTKDIDTIQGGCNEYVTPDPDVYVNSTMIICYYAGLGHYYKVVEEQGEYLVRRKIFEEASPDYDPPVQSFETIERF